MPRRCSSSSTESPSYEFVGSGRGHARPFPKWGTSCQLFLSPSSNGVFSGSPGRLGSGTASALRGVKAYVRLSPLPWSPLSVPSYPPRRGGGPVHPPFPHPPAAAVSCITRCTHMHCTLYHVCARTCSVYDMGACGVCVVSGCDCGLRVGSCWADMAVGQVLNSAVRRLVLPSARRELEWWQRSRPLGLVGDGCLTGNGPTSPRLRSARPWGTRVTAPGLVGR